MQRAVQVKTEILSLIALMDSFLRRLESITPIDAMLVSTMEREVALIETISPLVSISVSVFCCLIVITDACGSSWLMCW